MKPSKPGPRRALLREARQERDCGLLRELWLFVRHTRKWWLIPALIALVLLGALALLSGTAYAPFLSTLFWAWFKRRQVGVTP